MFFTLLLYGLAWICYPCSVIKSNIMPSQSYYHFNVLLVLCKFVCFVKNQRQYSTFLLCFFQNYWCCFLFMQKILELSCHGLAKALSPCFTVLKLLWILFLYFSATEEQNKCSLFLVVSRKQLWSVDWFFRTRKSEEF